MVKVTNGQGGEQTFQHAQAFSIGQNGVLLVLRAAAQPSVDNTMAAFVADNWRMVTTVDPQAAAS